MAELNIIHIKSILYGNIELENLFPQQNITQNKALEKEVQNNDQTS